ncbi:MAG TPA: hypothetical protein VF174_04125 [Micromonosporaceae bacterium]
MSRYAGHQSLAAEAERSTTPQARRASRPGPPAAAPRPVFVDGSGRRRRITVLAGVALGAGFLISLAMIIAGLLVRSPAPLPNWPDSGPPAVPDRAADQPADPAPPDPTPPDPNPDPPTASDPADPAPTTAPPSHPGSAPTPSDEARAPATPPRGKPTGPPGKPR